MLQSSFLQILKFQTCRMSQFAFVPVCNPVEEEDVLQLQNFIENNNNICVLTGAGVSTESGIPDYRSAGVGIYAKSSRRPVLYKDFCSNEFIRKRYWARNYVGWPRFSTFQPNDTHKTLKNLEEIGKVSCVVTQNVDNLHTKAGNRNVIELHGTAFRVMCLNCDHKIERANFQNILKELNPLLNSHIEMIRPDGDVDLTQEETEGFIVPPCENCGGILKPDIVFFGDNVPRYVVENVKNIVEQSSSLLILGTSLSTFSGYRIVLQALDAKKSIMLVNIGKTRADNDVHIKIEGRCGDVLSKACRFNDFFVENKM
ncbi:PREDICTED: NAD-dependent protein deacylase Sirt4 [Polistes canadensis]|uniref:NAD-dependent protein deacylase Sirt4 n=1 Tax=Polistes canadensis TaxID=91411 RepID=UPI000718C5C5|nr:PREDICTED: NAD-dependent protein deacylase Sirt4 [Polistes canadensis]